MSTEAEFRARARAEAIQMGMDPDAADFLVKQLGKKPLADQPRHPSTTARASSAPAVDSLAEEFHRQKLPASLLTNARNAGLPDTTIANCLNECPREKVSFTYLLQASLLFAAVSTFAATSVKGTR